MATSHTNTMYGSAPTADFKRLIVCCDGTWQAADKGFRSMPSNVVKFSRAISRFELNKEGREIQQVVYYQSGVATGEVGSYSRKFYGNLGMGLDQNVVSAYYFLSNNFDPLDEICLFGFSRGAYTVRILSDLIAKFGIIQKDHIDRFPVLFQKYTTRTSDEQFEADFRQQIETFTSHKTKVKVIGVWDTVGSMGAPSNWPWWLKGTVEYIAGYDPKVFRDAFLSENVENAYQALALDEHRAPFTPAVWHKPEGSKSKLIQCWFPGCHINIGGGSSNNRMQALTTDTAAERWLKSGSGKSYHEFIDYNTKTDLENMADITFAWMVDMVREHLDFDLYYVTKLERAMASMLASIPKDPVRGYAIGPMADEYSAKFGWALGGSLWRQPGQYDKNNVAQQNQQMSASDTNEYFHPSLRYRQRKVENWKPPALKGFVFEARKWRKDLLNGQKLIIPEWTPVETQWGQHGLRSAELMWMGEVANELELD